ncbi:hypothetical protein CEXT_61141 [Caerostris extrusa]|uniref:Uncharacterized protein n=1 Tax=Caerostris extrusa TaxID=172846 RepID=A0AAV4SHK5_CAEEX|nr:hypothetical protein CEXT_61141 [Caerostris extrusa]
MEERKSYLSPRSPKSEITDIPRTTRCLLMRHSSSLFADSMSSFIFETDSLMKDRSHCTKRYVNGKLKIKWWEYTLDEENAIHSGKHRPLYPLSLFPKTPRISLRLAKKGKDGARVNDRSETGVERKFGGACSIPSRV